MLMPILAINAIGAVTICAMLVWGLRPTMTHEAARPRTAQRGPACGDTALCVDGPLTSTPDGNHGDNNT